jgi:hypothetical protein
MMQSFESLLKEVGSTIEGRWYIQPEVQELLDVMKIHSDSLSTIIPFCMKSIQNTTDELCQGFTVVRKMIDATSSHSVIDIIEVTNGLLVFEDKKWSDFVDMLHKLHGERMLEKEFDNLMHGWVNFFLRYNILNSIMENHSSIADLKEYTDTLKKFADPSWVSSDGVDPATLRTIDEILGLSS